MEFKIIKNEEQYLKYCDELEGLLSKKRPGKADIDVIELVELLLDNWDKNRYQPSDKDPIELLKIFMADHDISSVELAAMLGISKSAISQILSYKRGLSKEVIRILADRFKVRQETFNRPYELVAEVNKGHKNEKMMNTKKQCNYSGRLIY
jgi:HTH-type transcriptional regulator/antitoxin HigA